MVSLMEVQARWAYSEVVDGEKASCYGGTLFDELRTKREANTPFEQLTDDEQYALALGCAQVRAAMMVNFAVGIDPLCLVPLTREQLAGLDVPTMVSGLNPMPFGNYVTTTGESPTDARNVQPPANGYGAHHEALTVGRYFNTLVLLDGYHRAVSFWKYAPADATISAYVPEKFLVRQ